MGPAGVEPTTNGLKVRKYAFPWTSTDSYNLKFSSVNHIFVRKRPPVSFAIARNSGNGLQTDSNILDNKTTRTSGKTHGQTMNALTVGATATLVKIEPCGSLQARKQANGTVQFFWRYSLGTQSQRIAIGTYDSLAPPKSSARTERGFSVTAAIRETQVQAQRHFEHKESGGYSQLLEVEATLKSQAQSATVDRNKQTLHNLLTNFNAKRIRSGVETLLAKYKFSEDLRGRLQSHGVSGVQNRHYDGHDYIDEKREMLQKLHELLESS